MDKMTDDMFCDRYVDWMGSMEANEGHATTSPIDIRLDGPRRILGQYNYVNHKLLIVYTSSKS